MEIRVLKYFLAVASEGNITKAAEVLHITQPTLSRQLLELEESLGTPLFVRGKRSISLTDSGIMFQQRAREIISLIEKAEREISEENQMVGGVVSVGCVESMASLIMPEAMAELSNKYPLVRYEFYTADGDDIRDELDSGSIDFGILVEPVETSKYEFMRLNVKDKWGVLMRSDDKLADKESIDISDLIDLPLIVPRRTIVKEEIMDWLGTGSEQLNIVASVNLLTNAILLAEKKLGYIVCIGGAYMIRPKDGMKFVPFSPEKTSGHVVAWKRNRIFNSAARLFVEQIRQLAGEEPDTGK
ncbi:LysR family transcriptional regulator [Youngiibacter multivorans]|uniref:DNA-binding transcriptional LysR family regulator n=1 Tax=Youngiibacter multivorans TaxID=937251 RepID=A0ABS4G6F5_9CLOT|nr:LysR family transcriptional regulator [Youngiibacter multivorans]MBP1920158.1 DNA-binding transcriptional LysR family regulator [Youngiibacter multivorans]